MEDQRKTSTEEIKSK